MFLNWQTAIRLLEVKLANMADCLSRVRDLSLVTSSNFVCWQGKEKVNPTGSFLSLMLCFSMKSPRHSATWSNSWSRREREMLWWGLTGRLSAVTRVRVAASISLLSCRCRGWCPPECRTLDSPSAPSASSHGSLVRAGSWSYFLPDPEQWSLPFLWKKSNLL